MILQSVLITLKLALVSTGALLFLSVVLVLLVSKLPGYLKSFVATLISLPLVLPPTVIGFYLLIALSKDFEYLGLSFAGLAFTFEGLVVGSVIYSLPFVYQPIQNSINSTPLAAHELAATLGARPLDRFFTITLPLARDGFIAAAILGFAHTIGEFGVVLMIGGNIPGETQILSVLLYEYVEMGDYDSAHRLSAILLLISFCLLFLMYRYTGVTSGFISHRAYAKSFGSLGK